MKTNRQISDESNSTQDAILSATETIIAEEGYAAVTSRRVAEKAGLKSQLVHYHFGSMDDLFVAVYERLERNYLRRHLQAAASDNPLRALWELNIRPQKTRLALEQLALANHSKAIRKITARVLEQLHSINAAFISKYLDEAGIGEDKISAVILSYLVTGLSRSLVTEEAMGHSSRHAEVLAFAERYLNELEDKRRAHRLAGTTSPTATAGPTLQYVNPRPTRR